MSQPAARRRRRQKGKLTPEMLDEFAKHFFAKPSTPESEAAAFVAMMNEPRRKAGEELRFFQKGAEVFLKVPRF